MVAPNVINVQFTQTQSCGRYRLIYYKYVLYGSLVFMNVIYDLFQFIIPDGLLADNGKMEFDLGTNGSYGQQNIHREQKNLHREQQNLHREQQNPHGEQKNILP